MAKWGLHERTTEEQARINHARSNYGKSVSLEATAEADDAWDVAIKLAGSGVVYDFRGANKPTGGPS